MAVGWFYFHFILKISLWIHWRRQWQPTPVLLPGKSHGRRSLIGCSPWGREELDMTERLHFHFSLSFIGEGNGNPLQCSCLENPRNGGAWWAAVYGVAQSQTRLKRLSSGSSSTSMSFCGLIAYFYGWIRFYCIDTSVCLSIHLLKDILVAPSVVHLWNQHSYASFSVDLSFQFIWVNT